MNSCRQYGRDDIRYETWYSEWMKTLARQHSQPELELMLHGAKADVKLAAKQHIAAGQKTHSMVGNSMARAHGRNRVEASGETAIALKGAIEIHELFPEHAKQ